MASIATYLQKIKDAIYGEEVRGSIHDAIKAMNEEVEDIKAIDVTVDHNEIVDARTDDLGTAHSSLGVALRSIGPRITELKNATAQSQKTLSKVDALWVAGGIGSDGVDYNNRNTSIRTNNYLDSYKFYRLVCEDGSLAYVAFYDSDKNFIKRNAITATEVDVRSLNGYSSSSFLRIELSNTSVSDYEKLKVEYTIKSEIEDVNNKINEINNESKDIEIINGTLVNAYNTDIVHTNFIPLVEKNVRLIVNRPLEEGYEYKYSYNVYNDSLQIVGKHDGTYAKEFCNIYAYEDNASYVAFNISEIDDNNTLYALRVDDFKDYPPKVVYTDLQKDIQGAPVEIERGSIIRGYPSSGTYISITGKHISVSFDCPENTKILINKPITDRFQILFRSDYSQTFFHQTVLSEDVTAVEFTTLPGTKNIVIYLSPYTKDDVEAYVSSVHVFMFTTRDSVARASIVDVDSKIDGLFTDINRESIWAIGGIGSNGEDYNARKYGIRTYEFIPIVRNAIIVVNHGYMIRFAQYADDGTFVRRTTLNEGRYAFSSISDETADLMRIEIEMVNESGEEITTPFTDVSAYTGIEINSLYDFMSDSEEDDSSFKERYTDLISQSRYIYSSTDSGISPYSALTLLHCTDLHGNFAGMKYVMDTYDKYSQKIDAILHTGDVVTANLSDGIANWIQSGCAEVVLNTIGNHDTEENLVLQAAGKDNVYNTIFAPYISGWGVTQPTGVDDSTSANYHALYYYKDFSNSNVRLIVLDTNFWDSAEKTWLSDVLDDALTNSLCVVIACHNVKKLTEMTDSNFSAYPGDGINENTNAYGNQPDDWLDPVQNFINSGGNFACILAGHNHSGHMGLMTNYQDIFVYVADKSSMSRTSGAARNSGEINQNTVSIVTINPVEKLFKIVKIGAEVDGKMRGKHVFCYDYFNKRIISQW